MSAVAAARVIDAGVDRFDSAGRQHAIDILGSTGERGFFREVAGGIRAAIWDAGIQLVTRAGGLLAFAAGEVTYGQGARLSQVESDVGRDALYVGFGAQVSQALLGSGRVGAGGQPCDIASGQATVQTGAGQRDLVGAAGGGVFLSRSPLEGFGQCDVFRCLGELVGNACDRMGWIEMGDLIHSAFNGYLDFIGSAYCLADLGKKFLDQLSCIASLDYSHFLLLVRGELIDNR